MAKGKSRPITDRGFFHARKRQVSAENLAEQHCFLRGGVVNAESAAQTETFLDRNQRPQKISVGAADG